MKTTIVDCPTVPAPALRLLAELCASAPAYVTVLREDSGPAKRLEAAGLVTLEWVRIKGEHYARVTLTESGRAYAARPEVVAAGEEPDVEDWLAEQMAGARLR